MVSLQKSISRRHSIPQAKSLILLLLVICILYMCSYCGLPPSSTLPCNPAMNIPCVYKRRVDLRIILLTFNRPKSLQTCLDHLQNLVLDGDSAEIVIWIDRSMNDTIDTETFDLANSFTWQQGSMEVRVHDKHVGIYKQWIYTWRPTTDSEHVIILEDDVDLSKYAYRWTKKVHEFYRNRTNFLGSTLTSELYNYGLRHPFKLNDTLFFFRHFYTWGFSPYPPVWRKFQDWYTSHLYRETDFKPYVPGVISTKWYKTFEKAGTHMNMWSIWFLYFSYAEQLYCAYSNFDSFGGPPYLCLARHRYEAGLHFKKNTRKDYCRLVEQWNDRFERLPEWPAAFNWSGHREY